jgi:hypothetical protein
MNQFRCKQLKSMVVTGCKTLANGLFTGAVQKKHLLPSGNGCSIANIKIRPLDLEQRTADLLLRLFGLRNWYFLLSREGSRTESSSVMGSGVSLDWSTIRLYSAMSFVQWTPYFVAS